MQKNESLRLLPVQWLKQHTELEQVLLLSAFFSLVLCFARVVCTGELLFVWLLWNLFLAYVPYAVTRALIRRPQWIESRWRFGLLFLVWLLFLPNSFYILTDLFHLDYRAPVPLWFDLALLLSFAWNGLLLGVLSLRQMERILGLFWPRLPVALLAPFLLFLSALGVYLGRYGRYNSWDLFTDPFPLLRDLLYLGLHPLRHSLDWGMIICYALLLSLIYATVKKLGRSMS